MFHDMIESYPNLREQISEEDERIICNLILGNIAD